MVSYRRQRILCDEPIRNALREAIEKTRIKYPFDIDAWVLLPDHLHCHVRDGVYSENWATQD